MSNWLVKSQIGWRDQTILWWGGLRGSVSIALAVSVPIILPGREEIIDMVFGVVLFTLLVQGLTTQWFLERLGLIGDQPIRQQYSEAIARRVALNRVLNYLLEAGKESEIDPEFYRYELQLVQGQLKGIEEEIEKLQNQYPQLRSLNMQQLREKLLDIEADTYAELIRAGRLNNRLSPVLQEILAESTEDERK